MNNFENLLSPQFKQLFNDAIDSIVGNNGLVTSCKLKYSNQSGSQKLCNNCLFDSISRLSSNIYNNTGPAPFTEGSICPVCLGMGVSKNDNEETVKLAVIFDSKYFVNFGGPVNIADGMVQTICDISLLPKLKDANEAIFNTDISNYGNYIYQRANDPQPCGLGSHKYIITMWKRK